MLKPFVHGALALAFGLTLSACNSCSEDEPDAKVTSGKAGASASQDQTPLEAKRAAAAARGAQQVCCEITGKFAKSTRIRCERGRGQVVADDKCD